MRHHENRLPGQDRSMVRRLSVLDGEVRREKRRIRVLVAVCALLTWSVLIVFVAVVLWLCAWWLRRPRFDVRAQRGIAARTTHSDALARSVGCDCLRSLSFQDRHACAFSAGLFSPDRSSMPTPTGFSQAFGSFYTSLFAGTFEVDLPSGGTPVTMGLHATGIGWDFDNGSATDLQTSTAPGGGLNALIEANVLYSNAAAGLSNVPAVATLSVASPAGWPESGGAQTMSISIVPAAGGQPLTILPSLAIMNTGLAITVA